jgi:hypothetical protein
MALLKIILVLALVYYFFKIVFKTIIQKFFIGQINETLFHSNRYQSNEHPKNEGEITIHAPNKKDKKIDKNDGEYVDFENIDD